MKFYDFLNFEKIISLLFFNTFLLIKPSETSNFIRRKIPVQKEKTYRQRLKDQKCCVVIPTYNNEATLATVIEQVKQYTLDIIVVNDGSTDSSATIIEQKEVLKFIFFRRNKGKGAALKTAFKAAEELGFEYAISIDSDGQLFASDIPVFLKALEKHQDKNPLLLIGAREMEHHSIPQKSNVGNKFSTFWFKVETGINLKDTQCGFRLYPLKLVNSLKLFTNRFEFEIEVIVKSAWKGATVANVPVKVFYDQSKRITHYKPWNDTARIVILNIYFVMKRGLSLFSGGKI